MSPFRRAARLAGSVQVGLVLMALLAAYVGVASVWPRDIARLLDTRPDHLYVHWLPVGLGALLCATILIAAIVRIPLRLAHAGAWCSHLGFLVLAAGTAWYALGSVSGYASASMTDYPDFSAGLLVRRGAWFGFAHFCCPDTYVLEVRGRAQHALTLADLDPWKAESGPVEYVRSLPGAPEGIKMRTLSYQYERGAHASSVIPLGETVLTLTVEVAGDLWSSEAHVPHNGRPVPVNMPNTPETVWLALHDRIERLPNSVWILRSYCDRYPGSVVPKDYRCEVQIGPPDAALSGWAVEHTFAESKLVGPKPGSDGNARVDSPKSGPRAYSQSNFRPAVIGLNHPIHLGPYQISHNTWLPSPENPEVLIFDVRSRPGLPLVWAGLAMIVAGMLFAFYVKPRLVRREVSA